MQKRRFKNPKPYFQHDAQLSELELRQRAKAIWRGMNEPNLYADILPTRQRADLILKKGDAHAVQQICLRKL